MKVPIYESLVDEDYEHNNNDTPLCQQRLGTWEFIRMIYIYYNFLVYFS